ncbi:MAG: homoserine O-succinyltransferase, partial [Arenibacterium sp.]
WTQTNVHSTFGVCWGGMAMLYHFYRIPKYLLSYKLFGAYPHANLVPASPYLRGFSDDCVIPVSRWTELHEDDIKAAGLPILLSADVTGPCLIEDAKHRALYILNHFEYDSGTLNEEYQRDLKQNQIEGAEIALPFNYFPGDDPLGAPQNRWRSNAHLLYGNWINQIYQTTPFDMDKIGG